jgi:hypothetical protein
MGGATRAAPPTPPIAGGGCPGRLLELDVARNYEPEELERAGFAAVAIGKFGLQALAQFMAREFQLSPRAWGEARSKSKNKGLVHTFESSS